MDLYTKRCALFLEMGDQDLVMNVLVTGATGAVGPGVVQALRKAGLTVRSFSLDMPRHCSFPPDVQALLGDVTDPVAVRSAMRGMDAVVHMAALLHIVNPLPELREKYEHVNVGGTSTVVEAAIKAGVKRVVLFSTIAVYGQAIRQVFNKQSPTNPDTYYAQTKLAAEKIVLNARSADGQRLGNRVASGCGLWFPHQGKLRTADASRKSGLILLLCTYRNVNTHSRE